MHICCCCCAAAGAYPRHPATRFCLEHRRALIAARTHAERMSQNIANCRALTRTRTQFDASARGAPRVFKNPQNRNRESATNQNVRKLPRCTQLQVAFLCVIIFITHQTIQLASGSCSGRPIPSSVTIRSIMAGRRLACDPPSSARADNWASNTRPQDSARTSETLLECPRACRSSYCYIA